MYSELSERIDQLTLLLKDYLREYFPQEKFAQKISKIHPDKFPETRLDNAVRRYFYSGKKNLPLTDVFWCFSYLQITLARQALSEGRSLQEIEELIEKAEMWFESQKRSSFMKKDFSGLGNTARKKRYTLIKEKIEELLLKENPPYQWKTATEAARSIADEVLSYDQALKREANEDYSNKKPYSSFTKMGLVESNIIRFISKSINENLELRQQIIKAKKQK